MVTTNLAWNVEAAHAIIDRYRDQEGPMLPLLHALQHEFGYVPREAEPVIAAALNLTRAEVHGVISFYHDFRREPAGRHILKLCRAEACQSMGSEANARHLLDMLGLDWGETTRDGRLTVEPVFCLGLCATAPSALLDGEPIGRTDAAILETLAREAA
ncbi:MAG: formate dehydrogenase subunit gamma [Acidiphilium sp.]|nr:formate dehydrogenase subunit gamma [Acidiphilium sp.]MDD4935371.1 formate dehydrogenase subunit gamma [Acidiphilium sp.]